MFWCLNRYIDDQDKPALYTAPTHAHDRPTTLGRNAGAGAEKFMVIERKKGVNYVNKYSIYDISIVGKR